MEDFQFPNGETDIDIKDGIMKVNKLDLMSNSIKLHNNGIVALKGNKSTSGVSINVIPAFSQNKAAYMSRKAKYVPLTKLEEGWYQLPTIPILIDGNGNLNTKKMLGSYTKSVATGFLKNLIDKELNGGIKPIEEDKNNNNEEFPPGQNPNKNQGDNGNEEFPPGQGPKDKNKDKNKNKDKDKPKDPVKDLEDGIKKGIKDLFKF